MKFLFLFNAIHYWGRRLVYPNSLGAPRFPYCDTNLKHLIRFWKAVGLYFYKNLQIYYAKMCKNKKFAKYDKLYIFIGPLQRQIQICENIWKILKKLNLYSRKTKNVQILYKNICAKSMQIVHKNCAVCFLLFKAFQRAIKSLKKVDLKINLVRQRKKEGIQAVCLRT